MVMHTFLDFFASICCLEVCGTAKNATFMKPILDDLYKESAFKLSVVRMLVFNRVNF